MKTIVYLAFVVSAALNVVTANDLTNSFNTQENYPLSEDKNCLHQDFVGLKDSKEQSKQIKISNGTGDPVMHSAVLGTVTVQTGILPSTGSGLALSLPGDNDYVSILNSYLQ